MSYRIYFRAIVNSAQTLVYNNTEAIGNYTDLLKIVFVGIKVNFTKDSLLITDAGSTKQYVDLILPVYSINKKSSFQFSQLETLGETKTNLELIKKAFRSCRSCDYLFIYINNLNGQAVTKGILTMLDSHIVSDDTHNNRITTLLHGKSTGGWALLVKPLVSNKPQQQIYYTKILETYSASCDIDLYHLTHSEFKYMNKDTWNSLFETNFLDAYINNYYETLFNQADQLIYVDSSDYLQILSRIHHHLTHPRDDNFDGQITNAALENPYYQIYPSRLAPDMATLQSTLETLTGLFGAGGLDKLVTEASPVIYNCQKSSRFLSREMIDLMVSYRTLYISIRTEFVTKISIVL